MRRINWKKSFLLQSSIEYGPASFSRCFAGTLVRGRRRDLAVAAANSQVGSRWCANVHLEFGFRQSFQGELVVRASAGVYTSQGWRGDSERGSRATAEGVSVGNFVLVLARNFGPPSYDPPSCPLASPVPLNKLVRFNDSYFFLVTRLPSFAPTRRLRKVAVNLVPSFAPALSLSISATRDHRDSGLTTVRLSPSSSQRCSKRRPRYQRMQSSPIQWNRRCSWAIIAETLVRHLH